MEQIFIYIEMDLDIILDGVGNNVILVKQCCYWDNIMINEIFQKDFTYSFLQKMQSQFVSRAIEALLYELIKRASAVIIDIYAFWVSKSGWIF